MPRTWFLMLSFVLGASSTFGQDITKLAPNRSKVEFENAQVRVLRFIEPPGGKLPMHSHPANVSIILTGANTRFTFPDGKTQDVQGQAGSVTFNDAVSHASENLGKSRAEVVMIELKTKPAGTSISADMDAAKVDPQHVTVELENDFVRVLRYKVEPHGKDPMHGHPAAVVVSVSPAQVRHTYADGTTKVIRDKAGAVRFTPAMKHAAENLSDKPDEVIVVELKTA